ncbi:MAG: glycosyltransferase family 39 protein [Gemmatimonadota bacterium]|nr:glycosyltransferase family 39 protein [Gemmatimonadota bacterium]
MKDRIPRPRMQESGYLSPRRLFLLSAVVGLVCLVAVIATIGDIGVTCDEPHYYDSCCQQIAWFRQAATDFSAGRWSAPFEPGVIDRYWNYQPVFNVHPPFYKLCSSLTLVIFEPWMGFIGAYRIAPAVMFSLLVAILFWTVGRRYGLVAGFWAAGSLALMPRVFGHAHFGATDMPISLLWFASAVSFHRALESRRWAVVFALIYGLALATKFTAFVIPLPLAAYILAGRRFKQAVWPVCIALVVSPLIMIGLNPQWWHNTAERIYTYLVNSANRSDYAQIVTYYLGKRYGYYLPWHHCLVYTLFTVFPLVLTGFIYGFWSIVRRPFSDQWASHMLLHWLALIAVMMLPSSPGHDGVRLFLPAFVFLAVVSAKGFHCFITQDLPGILSRVPGFGQSRERCKLCAWLLLGAALIPQLVALVRVHPYELSYYNSLAGGIQGAHRLGMETTYWWDPLNDDACRLINETIPDSAVVATMYNELFRFLQKSGKIKPALEFSKKEYDYLFNYNRQGLFEAQDWVLYRKGVPLAELKVDGVQLFAIYKAPEVFYEILTVIDDSKNPCSQYEKAVFFQKMGMDDRFLEEMGNILRSYP